MQYNAFVLIAFISACSFLLFTWSYPKPKINENSDNVRQVQQIAQPSIFPIKYFGCEEAPKKTNISKKKLSDLKMVLGTLGRDRISELPKMFSNIEKFSNLIQEMKVIFVENDSKDGTAEWVANYSDSIKSSSAKKTHKISEVILFSEKWHVKKKSTVVLARARNKILEILSQPKFSGYDFAVFVDTDMCYSWNHRNFQEIFDKLLPFHHSHWDVLFANGMFYWDKDGYGDHYDRFAYRDEHVTWDPADGIMWEFGFTRQLPYDMQMWWDNAYMNPFNCTPLPGRYTNYNCHMICGTPLTYVHSAFGGIGFYSMNLFQHETITCKYGTTNYDCEHIALNNCLRSNLGAKLAVVNRMIIPWGGCTDPMDSVHEQAEKLIDKVLS